MSISQMARRITAVTRQPTEMRHDTLLFAYRAPEGFALHQDSDGRYSLDINCASQYNTTDHLVLTNYPAQKLVQKLLPWLRISTDREVLAYTPQEKDALYRLMQAHLPDVTYAACQALSPWKPASIKLPLTAYIIMAEELANTASN